MGKKVIDILADNLQRNCGAGRRFETIVELEAKSRVGKSTIARMINKESSARIDSLEAIANAYGLESWQMLIPNMDPANAPKLLGDGLSSDEQSLLHIFMSLDSTKRAMALAAIKALRDAEAPGLPNKSGTTDT